MVRCNMCMEEFPDWIISCPMCNTDDYLMDLEKKMWTKYDYVCSDCDALIEITTLDGIPIGYDPVCPCGSNNTINIGAYDATVPDTDVTSITAPQVVKINSNPYN